MPPPGRYGPQGMNGQYSHLQQSQMPHHQTQQQHHPAQLQHAGLPPPSLVGSAGFGLGNSNMNAFSMGAGTSNTGLDTALGDSRLAGLGSQAAQMGFNRGAQMQQANHMRDGRDGQYNITSKNASGNGRIRDVWKHNLASEMAALRALVDEYPYISMDTEFPGIVARPIGSFTTKADYHYQTLRCNVDLLKMIQLGITLFSASGELPPIHDPSNLPSAYASQQPPPQAPCTWQFNFRFSLEEDMYAADSTAMLQKAGIDFKQHATNGIDPAEFGALLITSGLVLLPDVRWISFHSGYDFGYLMKLMLCKPLPEDEAEFHNLLTIFFPKLFDIKFLLKLAGRNQTVNNEQALTPEATSILERLGTKSGLQDIADILNIKRVGTAHQAGSDSWVTGQVYFEMRQKVFDGYIDEDRYSGQVWGLNGQMPSFFSSSAVANLPPGSSSGAGGRHLETPNLNGAVIYNHPVGNNASANTPGGGAMTPSTPANMHASLASGHNTPAAGGSAHGHLTPGGTNTGSGAFGQFQYAKA